MAERRQEVIGSTVERRALHEWGLVQAARTGSGQAFDTLMERYHAQVLRYFTRQTGDPELAADLTQDTFLDAYRRLDRLDDARPFVAWLFRIARYNLLHEWRRRVRRFASLDWLLGQGKAEQPALQRADRSVVVQERDQIQQVLDTLSPALREALLLHSLCGFSSQEIADILEISPAATRQRIARAKEQFRHEYHKLNGVDDDIIL